MANRKVPNDRRGARSCTDAGSWTGSKWRQGTKAKSVAESRLAEAFHAELALMDQEDEIAMLEIQRAKLRARRLAVTKQYKERLLELEDNDVSLSGEDPIGLPSESKEESVRRFLESAEGMASPRPETEHSPAMPRLQERTLLPSPHVESDTQPVQQGSSQQGLETLANSMAQIAKAIAEQNLTTQRIAISSQLPKLEVPVFDGNPLRYPLWNNAFTSLVDDKPLDGAVKLNYLNSYVSGEPKKIVEHYILMGTEAAYQSARELLARRFGSPSIVSTAFMTKLGSWPRITDRDPKGLQVFADFLEQVVAAKAVVDNLGILDYPQENVKMLAKLPFFMERQWRDEIERWQTRGYGSYPPFVHFVEFVRKAANRANIPELASLQRGDPSRQPPRSGSNKPQSGRSFATNGVTNGTKGEYSLCPCCGEKHHLDDCEEFCKKPYHTKKSFFFQKKLCMGCGTNDNHRVKDCNQRRNCRKCKGSHLTCLHRPEKQEEASSKCTNVCSIPDQDGRDHCMIVPVWVRHTDDPSREFLQYAILDDQSNVGFVSEALAKKLKVEGSPTNLMLTTMHQTTSIECRKIQGIEVLDFQKENIVKLPACFTRDEVPAKRSQIPKGEVLRRWPHLAPIAGELMPYNSAVEVSLLIGNNCPRVIRPRQVVCGDEDDPYAVKSLLGWGVVGTVCQDSPTSSTGVCNRIYSNFTYPTKAKEVLCPERIVEALEADFRDENLQEQPMSAQDHQFLKILEEGITRREDGHYEMPLPFKSDTVELPYNRRLAEKRLNQLKARFRKNSKFKEDYQAFMTDVIGSCAERAPAEHKTGRVNFVPHTGVYHPKKPGKIRVVFDCSAGYEGVSLNDHLLQGPDLTNGLLGVLCRFRQENVAVMADIKSMFHQFFVKEEDRDLLRFLWWEDGNPDKAVIEYRMKVHLFGAASSPGCANFGLKKAADDGEKEFGKEAADYIRREFYVDDGLKSVPTTSDAVRLLKAAQGICSKAGLRLHKIMSNKREVLQSVTPEDRAKGLADLDLDVESLPIERALGVVWCVENDTLQFRIELKDSPCTRRGILSTVCSIYDPNGFVSPVSLRGKQILQELCRRKLDWDSPVPEDVRQEWEAWRQEIGNLEKLQIQRCYKPEDFGSPEYTELHHFSDASYEGYGQCTYLRLINRDGRVSCSLVLAKSRVTPLKPVTIPRLELTAATTSAKLSAFLKKELPYPELKEYFWTDSKVVLGYIRNEARRFHVYVGNRVQQIHDKTDPGAWYYVDTASNPADDASRGLTATQLLENERWLKGPSFLHASGKFLPPQSETPIGLDETDPEIRKGRCLLTNAKNPFPRHLEADRFDRFSCWYRAQRAVGRCLQLKGRLQRKEVKLSTLPRDNTRKTPMASLTVSEMEEAEKVIIKSTQQEYFADELEELHNLKAKGKFAGREDARLRNITLKKSSALYRLDPYLDEDGIIRVGGRIHRANIPLEAKHPVVLPRKSHVSKLLILHHHQKVQHMGRGTTLNQLRQSGYWIIGGTAAVSQCISSCVTCRRRRGALVQQKMAELPEDRVEPSAPFTYCGVDYFGPFLVKERRSEVKRYGVLFTCMSSRSVHLETANSLSASSFINALRRFMNRRGLVRQMRSDQGTMFVGARSELKQALAEMNQAEVQEYLLQNGCDWIPFRMNVPHASHMGGVWERQIQSIRRVLEPLMKSAGSQLDDEAFRTFITEAEAIINSRPLSTVGMSDKDAPEPLTPLHLLTAKPKIALPPPGKFQREDMYARKWWRRVQFLTNQFWLRWRREYLQLLQDRQKWVAPQRDLAVGDVVIVKENDDARYHWPLARITEVFPSQDGHVRKVKIAMADRTLDNHGRRQRNMTYLDRPVNKLVLLVPSEQ